MEPFNISYKLTHDDYLTFQLYSSSVSPSQRRSRRNGRVSLPLIYLLFAVFTYVQSQNYLLMGILFSGAVLWYLFYPMYVSWRYKRHFNKHVTENYFSSEENTVNFDFKSDAIYGRDGLSESVIKYGSISECVEIPAHFLLKIASGNSVILPKRSSESWGHFKEILQAQKVEIITKLSWKWK